MTLSALANRLSSIYGSSGKTRLYGPYGVGEWIAPHIDLGNQSLRDTIQKYPDLNPEFLYTLSICPRLPGFLLSDTGCPDDVVKMYEGLQEQKDKSLMEAITN